MLITIEINSAINLHEIHKLYNQTRFSLGALKKQHLNLSKIIFLSFINCINTIHTVGKYEESYCIFLHTGFCKFQKIVVITFPAVCLTFFWLDHPLYTTSSTFVLIEDHKAESMSYLQKQSF